MPTIILASKSEIRADLLRRVNVECEVIPAAIDEETIKAAMLQDGAPARDIADALAEGKARKIAVKHPDSLVLGCDQALGFEQTLLSKPKSKADALAQLKALQGNQHHLWSAAVIYEDTKPIWRHVGRVKLTMRALSDGWLEDYVERNWESIQHSVGGYKLEEEGPRLFTRIEGDYFTVLGMPLLEILSFLTLRGTLSS